MSKIFTYICFIMTPQLKTFLEDHRKELKLSEIERQAGLPATLLSAILIGQLYRSLSAEQERAVWRVLTKLEKSITSAVKKNLAVSK